MFANNKTHAIVLLIIVCSAVSTSSSDDGECQSEDCGEDRSKVRSSSNDIDVNEVLDELRDSLHGIKKSCGEICETREGKERVRRQWGVWSPELEKEVDCAALFSNPDFDASTKFGRPLLKLPKFLAKDYTYQGRIPIVTELYDDSKFDGREQEGEERVWTEEEVDNIIRHFRKTDEPFGWYTEFDVNNIKRHLSKHMDVRGKHVLVIGTKMPWLEALLLMNGASEITTLEYDDRLRSEHPKINTITPWKMSEMYLDGSLPLFDAVVSFSSVEHSGLGRYGDQMNPWGDLITMARAWCVTKPGGLAMIGMPFNREDVLMYNANKVYGPVQLPHLFANWEQVHAELDYNEINPKCLWCYQPLFILRRPEAKREG